MTLDERFQKLGTLLKGFKITDSSLLSYGTAGFRLPADKLGGVAIRLGILACIRSLNLVLMQFLTNLFSNVGQWV